jgi:Listeria/Bacterioides repeat
VASTTQTQINLSWNAVSGASYYIVYQDGTGIPQTIYATNFTVGVSCGTTHSYYVKAINAGGTSGASNTVNGTALPCTLTYTLNVSAINGTVTKNPDQANYISGSNVTITATPNPGYQFVNWTVTSGTASIMNPNSANTTVMLTSGNATLTANFTAMLPYTVTLSSNPAAGGTTIGDGTFYSGTSVIVIATPNTGYTFTNWTEGVTVVSTNASYQFTLSGNRTLVANFAAIPYTVTLSSNPTAGGTTDGGGTFYIDNQPTVTATPNAGYTFTNWTENGNPVSTNANYQFPINGNRTLVANFATRPQYTTITLSSNPSAGGTVTKNPNQTSYNYGSNIILTPTPNTGYTFTGWSGDTSGTTNPLTVTMNGNKNITANFTGPYTSLSLASIVFDYSGYNNSVTVTSNTNWSVWTNDSWISTSGGGSGNGSITITCKPNILSKNTRTGKVYVSGTDGIEISQTGVDPYINYTSSVLFNSSGGSNNSVNVTSNTIWSVSTSDSWLSASGAGYGDGGGNTGNGTVTIACEQNYSTSAREGIVNINVGGAILGMIIVDQTGGASYTNISPTNVSFNSRRGTTNVNVSSNTSWSASTSDSWLSASGAGSGNGNAGSGDGSITIACQENTSTTTRNGTVSVSGGGTITVSQECNPLTGQQMYVKINGNRYLFEDLITDSLKSIYRANCESIKNKVKDKIDKKCYAKTGYYPMNYRYPSVPWPTELQSITYSQEGSDLYVSLTLNNLRIHWDQRKFVFPICWPCVVTCKLESQTANIPGWITIKARIQLLRDGTKYSLNLDNIIPDVSNFVYSTADDFANMFAPGTADDVNRMITESMDEMIKEMTDNFHFPIEVFNLTEYQGHTLNTDQAQEVLNALPITPSLGTPINGRLVINLDLMPGGSDPVLPTNPRYDYAGFGCPYYAFQQQPLQQPLLPGVSTITEQEQILIDKMAYYGANAIRCSIPWREIFPNLTSENLINGNPDDLVGATLDNAISAIPASVWSNTDMIFDRASALGLQVIPQTPQSESDLPRINGKLIAPDPMKRGDGYSDGCYYVAPNTYMYYLKIFTNAAVKKYGNRVSIWTIESEFNAARIGTFIQWRHGDSWKETAPGGFQDRYWHILVNAVRNNDPTAKIASNFHIINLLYGLDHLGPDLDIIGLDLYPNLFTAYPVIGDFVGELVRATRRVLTNNGLANKEVHVMETSYPGIDPSLDPSDGASIYECMYKFSYYRQKKFVEDAMRSALKFGAKGFFYYGFLEDENNKDAPDGEFVNFGSLVNIRTNPYSFKPAAEAFKTVITGGLVKSSHGNEETIATVPTEYGLSQNYPNPFNPSTVINYQLPNVGTQYNVSLRVYDMLGRVVETLVDGTKQAGYYKATFNASHLSSGIYFARLMAQSDVGKPFVQTIKLLLMK